jgi:hypothetical protein
VALQLSIEPDAEVGGSELGYADVRYWVVDEPTAAEFRAFDPVISTQ